MNVDRVRAIDYWVGVPLCALSTVALRLASAVGLAPKRKPLKRVLFIELSEMGSAILVDPAMRKIRKNSSVELFFVIFKRNKISLNLLGTVPEENIFTLRDDNLWVLLWDTLRFLAWARAREIDTVIDLELFSRFTALLTGFSGACRRVGFYPFHHEGLYRGELLTHRVAYNPHIHISKNFLSLVHAAASEKIEIPFSKITFKDEDLELPVVQFSEIERERMRGRVREIFSEFRVDRHSLVLVNPNASEFLPQRRWMPEYYVDLIRRILDRSPRAVVLITGAPSEKEGADEIRVAVNHPRCVNFAGKTSFGDLPLLYDVSSFMITNDSGPAHFASVTRMPTYVIFGPETPKLYGALRNSTPLTMELGCSPCVAATNHRKTACKDPVCLKTLLPESVFKSVLLSLDKLAVGSAQARPQDGELRPEA